MRLTPRPSALPRPVAPVFARSQSGSAAAAARLAARARAAAPRAAPFALAGACYAAVILLMALPLLSGFGQSIPVAPQRNRENDALLNLWILSWATHALANAPADVFQANIFHPEPNTLAYSEHQLGLTPIFAATSAVSGSQVVGFAVNYLLTFVLTGVATFALVRYWTGSTAGGLAAGLLFAFAPPRLAHHQHTQLLPIWWLPLTLLLVEQVLRRPTAGRAALAGLSFAMQWLSSIYLGWLLTCALGAYLLAAAVAERGLVRRRELWLAGLLAGGLATALVLPTLLPYRQVSERWAFEWPLSELLSHSATPASFLNVTSANLLYGPLLRPFAAGLNSEQQLFLGFGPLALALIGIVACLRAGRTSDERPRGRRWLAGAFVCIGLGSLVLSLGPYLGPSRTFPLPYLALTDWVPGFAAMRNPARFVFLVSFALAVLSGLGVAALLARARAPLRRALAAGAILALLGAEVFSVLPAERLPEVDREAVAYLGRTAGDGPLVELPLSWERGVAETSRMYASTFHWRPLVSGHSGFRPPTEALESILQEAEPRTVADVLRVLGVWTLLVHSDELRPDERERFASAEWREAGFAEALRTERSVIWTLEPRGSLLRASEVTVDLQAPRTAAAGRTFPVRLLMTTEDGRIFHDPVGGSRPLSVRWAPREAGLIAAEEALRVAFPRVVVSKPQVKVQLELLAPERPGAYQLELRGEHFSSVRPIAVTGRPS